MSPCPVVPPKGEISTNSGSATSTTGLSSVGDDELVMLEKEVEGEINGLINMDDKEGGVPTPNMTPPVNEHPSLQSTAASAAPHKPAPAAGAGVTGNLASGLGVADGGLLPSEIHDPEVEERVRNTIGKMDENQFTRALSEAKFHPDFNSFVTGIRLEIGDESGTEWHFGEEEPEEDLVGFYVWAHSKANLRKRLGLEGGGASHGGGTALRDEQHPSMGTGDEKPPSILKTNPSQQSMEHKQGQPAVERPLQSAATEALHDATPKQPQPPVPEQVLVPSAEPKQPTLPPPPSLEPKQPPSLEPKQPTLPPPPSLEPKQPTLPPPPSLEPKQPTLPPPPSLEPAPEAGGHRVSWGPTDMVIPPPPPPGPETPGVTSTATAATSTPAVTAPTAPPPTKAIPHLAPPAKATATTPATATAPAPSQLSATVNQVLATTETPKAPSPKTPSPNVDDGLPTSVTHRAEYMAYLRAARNPHKLPAALRANFASADTRLDLFRLWLDKGRDFNQVQIEIQRRNTQRQTATSRNTALSRTQLLADSRYTEADVDALIARRTAEGAYIPDPNFPDRLDLRQYVVHTETSAEDARVREDTQAMNSTTTATAAEAMPMLEEGNDFAINTAPTVRSITSELAGLPPLPATPNQTGPQAKPKPKPKPRGGKAKKGEEGNMGEGDKETPPDRVPTPLEKAKLLKTKVFLVSIFVSFKKAAIQTSSIFPTRVCFEDPIWVRCDLI